MNLALWLAFIMAAVVLIYLLSKMFPGRMDSFEDRGEALRGVLLVALLASGFASRRFQLRQTLRSLAIWTAIAAMLLLGYSLRDEAAPLAMRLRSEILPSYPVAVPSGEMMVTRDVDGAFYMVGHVDGQAVRFLVDTGSSGIVLSPAAARLLGIDPDRLTYGKPMETANGVGLGASYTAPTLDVGPVHLSDVPMSINKTPMSSSLLGMAFFNRLQSFRFEGGRLYLKPKVYRGAIAP